MMVFFITTQYNYSIIMDSLNGFKYIIVMTNLPRPICKCITVNHLPLAKYSHLNKNYVVTNENSLGGWVFSFKIKYRYLLLLLYLQLT